MTSSSWSSPIEEQKLQKLQRLNEILLLLSENRIHNKIRSHFIQKSVGYLSDCSLSYHSRSSDDKELIEQLVAMLKVLENMSRICNIPMPIDHVIEKKSKLDIQLVSDSFGLDVMKTPHLRKMYSQELMDLGFEVSMDDMESIFSDDMRTVKSRKTNIISEEFNAADFNTENSSDCMDDTNKHNHRKMLIEGVPGELVIEASIVFCAAMFIFVGTVIVF